MTSATAAKPAPEFVFRGNVVASGGYLSILDGKPVQLNPEVTTVHGESSLPGLGGVSHSVVEAPGQPFSPWITYGKCETRAQGLVNGTATNTVLTASVENVRVRTRPSPEDHVSDIQEIGIISNKLSLSVISAHPTDGQPTFRLAAGPVIDGLALRSTPAKGDPKVQPIELIFDHPLIEGVTLADYEKRFTTDRKFFQDQSTRFPAGTVVKFGQQCPRDPHGYVVTSIVKAFKIGGKLFPGNEYFTPGFGRLIFGRMLAQDNGRRITLLRVRMGSDPKGQSDHCDVDTNGVWS